MSFYQNLKRIRTALHMARIGYKDGGYSSVKIACPDYNKILHGKIILVTGGGSGIGFAIAKKCVECGARVIITGRNEEKLRKAIIEIGRDSCNYLKWDVSAVDDIEKKLYEIENIVGGAISCVINNAGVAPSKFWGNVDEEEWRIIYDNNLKGLYFLTQAIVKLWNKDVHEEFKKIINISSQGGFVGATYPYRMVKWDIRGLTEGLGRQLIKDRIIVNGIAPGVVKTNMQKFSLNQGNNLYTNQNPIERVILPEEIAELAIFLLSDASNAIVGQTIVCDGGYTLK